jgi:hypothetical protein
MASASGRCRHFGQRNVAAMVAMVELVVDRRRIRISRSPCVHTHWHMAQVQVSRV